MKNRMCFHLQLFFGGCLEQKAIMKKKTLSIFGRMAGLWHLQQPVMPSARYFLIYVLFDCTLFIVIREVDLP